MAILCYIPFPSNAAEKILSVLHVTFVLLSSWISVLFGIKEEGEKINKSTPDTIQQHITPEKVEQSPVKKIQQLFLQFSQYP